MTQKVRYGDSPATTGIIARPEIPDRRRVFRRFASILSKTTTLRGAVPGMKDILTEFQKVLGSRESRVVEKKPGKNNKPTSQK
jgi:hypothetical protein